MTDKHLCLNCKIKEVPFDDSFCSAECREEWFAKEENGDSNEK